MCFCRRNTIAFGTAMPKANAALKNSVAGQNTRRATFTQQLNLPRLSVAPNCVIGRSTQPVIRSALAHSSQLRRQSVIESRRQAFADVRRQTFTAAKRQTIVDASRRIIPIAGKQTVVTQATFSITRNAGKLMPVPSTTSRNKVRRNIVETTFDVRKSVGRSSTLNSPQGRRPIAHATFYIKKNPVVCPTTNPQASSLFTTKVSLRTVGGRYMNSSKNMNSSSSLISFQQQPRLLAASSGKSTVNCLTTYRRTVNSKSHVQKSKTAITRAQRRRSCFPPNKTPVVASSLRIESISEEVLESSPQPEPRVSTPYSYSRKTVGGDQTPPYSCIPRSRIVTIVTPKSSARTPFVDRDAPLR